MHQLLEPSTRDKRPLLIPDFISPPPPPEVLREDKEIMLGDTRIVLKTVYDNKLALDKISFPQWSAGNCRIMVGTWCKHHIVVWC